MALRTQKKFLRNMLRLCCMIIIGIVIGSVVTLILSIRPPEGNSTLNISGQAGKELPVIVDNNNDNSLQFPASGDFKQVYTFLVAGKDKVADNTDTIMLIKFDVSDKKINILHIPRDTMLDTDRAFKKVNSSYQVGGIEQFERDIKSLTGFYVNRYVLFDLKGVEKVIDAIGGIDFYIPRNMYYKDPTQNLYINFKKGQQHLSGADVVKLARYRSGYTNGDIGRIEMQQQLIKALVEQALKPENLVKILEIVNIVNENVETDIDLGNMIWLANQAKDINLSDIKMDLLPGTESTIDSLSYWLPYKNELLILINDRFNPLKAPITESDISIVSFNKNRGK